MKQVNEKEFATDFLKEYNWDNAAYVNLHRCTAAMICNELHPFSVLDYGCGIGITLKPFLDFGVYCDGYDPNLYLLEHFVSRYTDLSSHFFTEEKYCFDKSYDVLFSCEVFEHMTDEEITRVMKNVKFRTFVFSSTPNKAPGFDEHWGHINVKSGDEWILYFRQFGLKYIKNLTLPTEWTKVFQHE